MIDLRRHIRDVPDFPKPGIVFRDITPLLADRTAALRQRIAMRRAGRESAADSGVPRVFMIEDEYAEALDQAELEWVEGLVKEIEGGSLDGVDVWRSFHEHREFEFPDPTKATPEAGAKSRSKSRSKSKSKSEQEGAE